MAIAVVGLLKVLVAFTIVGLLSLPGCDLLPGVPVEVDVDLPRAAVKGVGDRHLEEIRSDSREQVVRVGA
jgi:hypothetical protein